MTAPYYSDDSVTLYLGDCLEVCEWLAADVLVTDPPYGRGWTSGSGMTNGEGRGRGSVANGGIANDNDTSVRDIALELWLMMPRDERPAVVFGDPLVKRPADAVQALAYHKAADSGIKGARAGHRRDLELIYLCGTGWPVGVGGASSVLRSSSWVAGPTTYRYGHPHAKPLDLLEYLIALRPGTIADPFAGSGSTLVAAKALGRKAIGVELDERYCEIAARRLAQDVTRLRRRCRMTTCAGPQCRRKVEYRSMVDRARAAVEGEATP